MTGLIDALAGRLRRWLDGPSFREILREELQEGHAVRLHVTTLEQSLELPNRPARVEGPVANRIRRFQRG